MNTKQMTTALALVGSLWASAALAASPDNPAIWTSISPAQARTLVDQADGQVASTEITDDGGYIIHTVFPGGMLLDLSGITCKGEGEAKTCTEYLIRVDFETRDPETARRLDEDRDVNFVADSHDGNIYSIWRMGFTYGGVTPAYLLNTLKVVLDISWDVQEALHPKGKQAAPEGSRPANSGALNNN